MNRERELELWRLCSEGDMASREELIVSYRPLVFWIAGKIRTEDKELRDDIIQEGMLGLIQAVDNFDPSLQYRFSTYAYHKIHGRIINLLERSEKRAPLPVPDEFLNIESEYSSGEEWLYAEEAIQHLEGREAEIVSALFYDGKKPKDIAKEKKLDISQVYRIRRSAVARMRRWLGIEGA